MYIPIIYIIYNTLMLYYISVLYFILKLHMSLLSM